MSLATAPLTDCYALDMAIIPMVERMQYNGMGVDTAYFAEFAQLATDKIQAAVSEIHKLTGVRINPGSPDQSADLIYNRLGMDSSQAKRSKKTGKISTNKKSVEAMRTLHKAIDHLVTAREWSKARDSFALPIVRGEESGYLFRTEKLKDGRVFRRLRCNLRVTRVVSGRIAASNPNLMAIPVRTQIGLGVRKGFKPAPGRCYVELDLDQIEMRVMADESGDVDLVQLFNDGRDIHSYTGARMFKFVDLKVSDMTEDDWAICSVTKKDKKTGEVLGGGVIDNMLHRYPAKRVGFGVITGIQGPGLLDQMRMAGLEGWTLESCEALIADYLNKVFTGVKGYMDECRHEATVTGKIACRWGRIRYLPGAGSDIESIAEESRRQSHSHRIQSGAQGILKRAMAIIWNKVLPLIWDMGYYCEPILQVHDALQFECDIEVKDLLIELVQEAMTNLEQLGIPEFKVPLGAKGGSSEESWADLEK